MLILLLYVCDYDLISGLRFGLYVLYDLRHGLRLVFRGLGYSVVLLILGVWFWIWFWVVCYYAFVGWLVICCGGFLNCWCCCGFGFGCGLRLVCGCGAGCGCVVWGWVFMVVP